MSRFFLELFTRTIDSPDVELLYRIDQVESPNDEAGLGRGSGARHTYPFQSVIPVPENIIVLRINVRCVCFEASMEKSVTVYGRIPPRLGLR